MDIAGGMLGREITRIAGSKTDHRRHLQATLLAGPNELKAISVTRLDTGSDFESSYRDDIALTVLLPLGALMKKVGPYQDDLSVIVKEVVHGTYDFKETTYRAFLMEELPNDIEASTDPAFRSEDISNRLGNVNITLSLMLPLVEQLDAIHTGTVVRQVPPFSVLKVLFRQYVDAINFAMDEGIRSISMVEPANLTPRKQIIIPHNTRLVDLPDLLQETMGGVYSSGMGFYLSRRDLFFWPLYDVLRDSDEARVHVYFPTTVHSSILDNTYRREGKLLSILVSGKPKVIDDSLGQTFHHGDSIRYLDGNTAFDRLGSVSNSTITADRRSRNVEVTPVHTGKRVSTVSGDSQHITSNVYKEMSKKAKMNGLYVMLEWRYSNHHLIRPGMLATLFLTDGGGVREVPGIVTAIHSKMELEVDGVTGGSMLSSSVITFFVKREDWKMQRFIEAGQQRHVNTTQ